MHPPQSQSQDLNISSGMLDTRCKTKVRVLLTVLEIASTIQTEGTLKGTGKRVYEGRDKLAGAFGRNYK